MKIAFQDKEIAGLRPETLRRIQNEYAATVQDNFERHYKVGRYMPSLTDKQSALPPTEEQLILKLHELNNYVQDRFNSTQIEARKQKFEMVSVHLGAALRYLQKAFRP